MRYFLTILSLIALLLIHSCNQNNDSTNNNRTQKNIEKDTSDQDAEFESNEVIVLEGDGFTISQNRNGKVESRKGDKTTVYIDGYTQKAQEIFWEKQNIGRFKVRLNDGSIHIFDEGNPHEIIYEKKSEIPHKETPEEHKEKQKKLMKDPTLTADYNVLDTLQRNDNVVVLTKDHRLWYYNKNTGHRAVFYNNSTVESVEWKSFEAGELLCHFIDGTESVVQVGKAFPITGTKYHPYHKDPPYPSRVVIDANAVSVRTCPSLDKDCLLRNSDGSVVKLDKDTTLPYINEVKGKSRKDSFYEVEYDGDIYYVCQYHAYAE